MTRRTHRRFPRGGSDPSVTGYPYDDPAERGARPTFAVFPEDMPRRKLRPQAQPGRPSAPVQTAPGRLPGLTIDSISVGINPQVILQKSGRPRRVILRSRGAAITYSTNADVAAGGGDVLDPGERSLPFDVPVGASLYGVAAAAGGFLSRTVMEL